MPPASDRVPRRRRTNHQWPQRAPHSGRLSRVEHSFGKEQVESTGGNRANEDRRTCTDGSLFRGRHRRGVFFEAGIGSDSLHPPLSLLSPVPINEALAVGVGTRADLIERDGLCLLYTSDAADERSSVDLGGRRLIKK